jgi:hypothetical protein
VFYPTGNTKTFFGPYTTLVAVIPLQLFHRNPLYVYNNAYHLNGCIPLSQVSHNSFFFSKSQLSYWPDGKCALRRRILARISKAEKIVGATLDYTVPRPGDKFVKSRFEKSMNSTMLGNKYHVRPLFVGSLKNHQLLVFQWVASLLHAMHVGKCL